MAISLTMNGRPVTVESGATILDAATSLGVHVPTLCHVDGFPPHTSCMVCVVRDEDSGRLLPACSMPAADGMRIDTESDEVREARRDALELLISEHVGDCDAPCTRACPAGMNIPRMIRRIGGGRFADALDTVREHIALPAVLGRICPAPCEKACRRGAIDTPVAVCLLKRFAADTGPSHNASHRPDPQPKSGRRIAIVGAGPAGLSAGYYLALMGHDCRLFDRNDHPGGALRYDVPRERLPLDALDADIGAVLAAGVELNMNRTLGRDLSLADLRKGHDAVVLTFGADGPDESSLSGIDCSKRGIAVDRNTFETSLPGVFAGGNAIGASKLAVRAAAHGRSIAHAVHRYVSCGTAGTGPARFNALMGRLLDGEAERFMDTADPRGRVVPSSPSGGFTRGEAEAEAGRCLGCDCRKPESCLLRRYADEYGVERGRYRFRERRTFRRTVQHGVVVFEPGKCIKCGACIAITAAGGERFGLAFVDRGFDAEPAAPFGESLGDALEKTAERCIAACPTAALSRYAHEEGS